MITKDWAVAKTRQIRRAFPLPKDVTIGIRLLKAGTTWGGMRISGLCTSRGIIDGKRHYSIGIVHTLDSDDAVLVLLHEYRHVMQWVNGWLSDHPLYAEDGEPTMARTSTWHGQSYGYLSYWALPWEVDARQFAFDNVGDFFDE
jgi:hypothetical protein